MMLEGWISHEEFFNPENLQRMFANAVASSALLPENGENDLVQILLHQGESQGVFGH
jgi:hypothetical protein